MDCLRCCTDWMGEAIIITSLFRPVLALSHRLADDYAVKVRLT